MAKYQIPNLESETDILILFGFLHWSTFVGHIRAGFRSKVGNPPIIAIFGLRQYQLAELANLGIQCGILACQAKLTLFFYFKDSFKLISRLMFKGIVIFLNDVIVTT